MRLKSFFEARYDNYVGHFTEGIFVAASLVSSEGKLAIEMGVREIGQYSGPIYWLWSSLSQRPSPWLRSQTASMFH